MKPMTDIKQSAILFPQEQAPSLKSPVARPRQASRYGAPQGNYGVALEAQSVRPISASQHQVRTRSSLELSQRVGISQVSEEAQKQRFGSIIGSGILTGTSQKPGQVQDQLTDVFQTRKQKYGLVSIQDLKKDVSRKPDQTQRIVQAEILKIDTKRQQDLTQIGIVSTLQGTSSRQKTGQTTDQLTRQTTKQQTRQTTDQITDRVTINKPVIIPILPGLPSGGSGGSSARGKSYFPFKERAPTWTPTQQMRALLTGRYTSGKKAAKVSMPKVKPAKKSRGRKK